MRSLRAAIAATALLVAVAAPAQAAEEARALLLRAEQLAAADRCDEALPRARRARTLAPGEARAALVEGRCALRLGRYEDAIEPLETARRLEPGIQGIALDLAIAHFHRGQLAAADLELKQAETEDPDSARVTLYRGLILLQTADHAEGAAMLDRAGRQDAEIAPAASYYAGLAWGYTEDREKARESLERVVADAPGTPWAAEAQRALDQMDPQASRHWFGSIQGGMEYDSNVVLRGTGATVPTAIVPGEISRGADWRGVWAAEAGGELLRNEDWSVGAVANYFGSAHINLTEFNWNAPTAAVWVDRGIDQKSFVRVRPYFGFAWRDGESYLQTIGGDASYYRNFESAGHGRLWFGGRDLDFRFRIPDDPLLVTTFVQAFGVSPRIAGQAYALNESLKVVRDRDGVELSAGYEHDYDIGASTNLRGGAAYIHYDSKGREWAHQGPRLWLGVRQALPWELSLDVLGSYGHDFYRNASSYQDGGADLRFAPFSVFQAVNRDRRNDDIWAFAAILERSITESLKATVRYRYTNNESNTPVFDYDRHVVGGYITYAFGN